MKLKPFLKLKGKNNLAKQHFISILKMYKFLIYISYSYGFPIGKPIYEELKQRNYEVKWFVDTTEAKQHNPFAANTLDTVEEVLAYEPHIVLTAANVVPDFFPGLKVQIFHGFNAEKRNFRKGHFRIRGFFDLYCTQGPSTTSIFKEKQKEHPHFDVIETGWSKMDAMFPIPEKEGNQRNTILIASTFTKKLSLAFDEELFNKIKILSEKGTFKFMQILHPKLPDDIKSKWKSLQGENFQYHDTTDIIPLMHQADIMLSDTSSVIQEFLLQRKPVVTFRHNIPQDHIINVNEVSKIEEALSYALSYPAKKISLISKYISNIHPYDDGNSSARIVDASILFLHKDKSYLKNKPINFARKWKVRRKLGYFTFKSFVRPFTLPKNKEI
jgi:CDP-glycerol glycerophosphotransferase (TagB/SpsB family)